MLRRKKMYKGNITLNGTKALVDIPNGNLAIDLRNGSLVLHFSKNRKELLGAYLVTSFRDSKGRYNGDNTQSYCSLIDMKTGYLKFEERCSRSTTMSRVLSHLSNGDFEGKEAIKRGEFIEAYNRSKYNMDFSFSTKDNEGWSNE